MSREVVVVDGVRTPYARAGTELKDVSAADLGRIVIVELLARTEFDPKGLDQVIFGNIAQPRTPSTSRGSRRSRPGVPGRVPAFTVEPALRLGRCSRSWTRTTGSQRATPRRSWPRASSRCRRSRCSTRRRARTSSPTSSRRGTSGGRIARGLAVPAAALQARDRPADGPDRRRVRPEHGGDGRDPREGAPASRARSRTPSPCARTSASTLAREKLAEEIVPVPIPPKLRAARDAGQRRPREPDDGGAREAEAVLRPKFGTVTAGNSSQITDGGAAALVMSAERREGARLQAAREDPRLRILFARARAHGPRPGRRDAARAEEGRAVVEGHRPRRDQRGLRRAGARLRESVPVGGVAREVRARAGPSARSTGSARTSTAARSRSAIRSDPRANRLVTTLLREMRRRGTQFGLATMCIGGGQGGAAVVASSRPHDRLRSHSRGGRPGRPDLRSRRARRSTSSRPPSSRSWATSSCA